MYILSNASKIVTTLRIVLTILGIAALAAASLFPLSIVTTSLYIIFALLLISIIVPIIVGRSPKKTQSAPSKKETPPTNGTCSKWDIPKNLDEAYIAMRKQSDELGKVQKAYSDERQKNNTIREIAHQISVQKDIPSLYRFILARLRAEFNSHGAFIMSLENGVVKLQHSDGSLTDMTLRFLEMSGLLDPLIKEGNTIRLGRDDNELIMQAMLGSHDKINNLLCVPLKTQSDDQPFAIIGLANYMLKGDFTKEHEDFLKLIAIEVAISIRNLGYISELEKNYEETMLCLAQALEGRDKYTHGHVDRVRDLSEKLAIELKLPEEDVKLIRRAATLHDVGKIATPDCILHKQAPLTDEEWVEMKKHAIMSAKILEPITSLPRVVIDMVLYHHERWDGKGYPYGLSSTDIPQGAQIIAVADAFDAMTTDRPYRKGMTFEEALERLEAESMGTQFRPDIITAFINMMKRRLALKPEDPKLQLGVGKIQRILFNPIRGEN